MDRRIQQALDGELARDELTPGAAGELAETEAQLSRVIESIPAEPLPDLSAAVLQRIRDERRTRSASRGDRHGRAAALRWLWTPRQVQWRPVYALAAAAALLLAIAATRTLDSNQSAVVQSAVVEAKPAAVLVFVQFRLEAPEANAVALAGDFTRWRPAHVMNRSASGVWTVVVPIEPGVHEYAFVIDGRQWIADPYAPAVSDGFGGTNSRLAILTPDSPRPL